ncbi:Piwi-domain-containing protein [Hypoxylon sp. FL1284]|nr:Piwi-domain-containing protein [Hypoxylon sp. FL1284]
MSAGGRSPQGSVKGSRPPTPSGSQVGSSVKPLGYDPAKPRALTAAELIGKRVDLPAEAYNIEGKKETRFTARPGYNTEGQNILMGLNIFPVTSYSNQDIYQYDVTVTPNPRDSHPLVKKVWNNKTVTEYLNTKGGRWLCDGHKLAWSSKKIERNEARISVNLDELKQKAAEQHKDIVKRVERNSVYELHIRQTKVIRLSYMKAYLAGQIAWDSHVLECMNFFDHCMRQYPSEQWVTIKRNFYDPSFTMHKLADDLVINQGVYLAPRLSDSITRGGTGLAINVDRCQTAFWPEDSLDRLALRLITSQSDVWAGWTDGKLFSSLKPKERVVNGQTMYIPTETFLFLRRMTKLKFVVNHRGKLGEPKIYTVKKVMFDPKYKTGGATAFQVTFPKKMPDGKIVETTILDHYRQAWNIRLQFPHLPIIETTRGGLYPMELCNTIPDQRYTLKLNAQQTSDMIRFAATKPPKRREDIMEGVTHLKWAEDPCLQAFGIKIDRNMAVSQAKLLRNPEITFGNQKVNPGVSGRWDLRGKKFLEANAVALTSWSFICCGEDGRACHQNELENFARRFSDTYRNHGGKVAKPALAKTLGYGDGDYGKICAKAYEITREHFKVSPQIIFFVLPTKNQLVYERIKRSMDCRFNIVSQCLAGNQVKKAQAQYMSNVAMKVNSKLGGVTCKIQGPTPTKAPFWDGPTMIVGLDVSHGPAGSVNAPSLAALTMSMDKHATRYAAACQTNDKRTEIVQEWSMATMFPKLLHSWIATHKAVPKHIYFIRDGVSEGQFNDVLETEVGFMEKYFRDANKPVPMLTVIIATKRHHVRFFPKPIDKATGDRNGNPLPGTLVERDVTHPKHYDFYLCSHVAIQGTARPVHYQVIRDDAKVPVNHLQKMIYQQCYQYCRSTTPVSLHPAVYYSHLVSNRARAHESALNPDQRIAMYTKKGFPVGTPILHDYDDLFENKERPPKLIEMNNAANPKQVIQFINETMWFV